MGLCRMFEEDQTIRPDGKPTTAYPGNGGSQRIRIDLSLPVVDEDKIVSPARHLIELKLFPHYPSKNEGICSPRMRSA